MTNAMLEVNNLTKIYDELGPSPKKALDDVSFKIKNNEFVCIMGPSGCGKTTLVNILSTIDKATTGIVTISGESIVGMSGNAKANFHKNKLGFIFQNYNLLYSLTIRENILFPLIINGVNKDKHQELFDEIVKELDIESILDKYVYECSGGQQQRVAIARALITKPEIIIADEPTGNLDSHNSRELMELFSKINQTTKTTIIMVSHDAFVASYSTKMLYMKDGKIDQIIERGNMKRDDYFNEIVKINAILSNE